MGIRFWVLGGLLCVAAAVQAQAQVQAAPRTAGAASQPGSGKGEAAGASLASQAMERAQRQAANPMRAILEAAKIQRRPIDVATAQGQAARRPPAAPVAPAVAAATTAATEQVRTAAAGTPRPALANPAAAAPPSPTAQVMPTVTSAPTVPLALPVEPTAAGPTATSATSAGPPSAGSSTAAPTVGPLGSELAVVPAPAPGLAITGGGHAGSLNIPLQSSPKLADVPAAVSLPQPTGGSWRPKVLSMVEPAITARQWDDLRGGLVLETDISLRADGSVAAVSFASLAPRALLRVVQDAVEQWRFEPVPTPRTHRVQLVLNPPQR